MRPLALTLCLVAVPVWAEDLRDFTPQAQACIASDDPAGCIGDAAFACVTGTDQGATTLGMVDCAGMELGAWDAQLNAVYSELVAVAKYRDAQGGHFGQDLRDAQRAWIGFRDAECAMAYTGAGEGSLSQVAAADCVMKMTAKRVIDLTRWRVEWDG